MLRAVKENERCYSFVHCWGAPNCKVEMKWRSKKLVKEADDRNRERTNVGGGGDRRWVSICGVTNVPSEFVVFNTEEGAPCVSSSEDT